MDYSGKRDGTWEAATVRAQFCSSSLIHVAHCSAVVAVWTLRFPQGSALGCGSQLACSAEQLIPEGPQSLDPLGCLCCVSCRAPDCIQCPEGTAKSSPRWRPRGWAAAPLRLAQPAWRGRPGGGPAPREFDGSGSRRRRGWRWSKNSLSMWQHPPAGPVRRER